MELFSSAKLVSFTKTGFWLHAGNVQSMAKNILVDIQSYNGFQS